MPVTTLTRSSGEDEISTSLTQIVAVKGSRRKRESARYPVINVEDVRRPLESDSP